VPWIVRCLSAPGPCEAVEANAPAPLGMPQVPLGIEFLRVTERPARNAALPIANPGPMEERSWSRPILFFRDLTTPRERAGQTVGECSQPGAFRADEAMVRTSSSHLPARSPAVWTADPLSAACASRPSLARGGRAYVWVADPSRLAPPRPKPRSLWTHAEPCLSGSPAANVRDPRALSPYRANKWKRMLNRETGRRRLASGQTRCLKPL